MADSKPSYLKAAFANLYNLVSLGGIATASLATGDWWLLGLGLAAEALWLLYASDSARFRRAVDARHAEQQRLQEQRELEERVVELPVAERNRVQLLRARVLELRADARRHPVTAGDFMQHQLERLDALVPEFLRLALTARRCESYLARTDPRELERSVAEQQRLAERADDEAARDIARQNEEILGKRLRAMEELGRYVSRARAQMTLIENSVALLRDQLIAVKQPESISGEVDRIVAGVEAIKEATQAAEQALGAPAPVASAHFDAPAAAAAADEDTPVQPLRLPDQAEPPARPRGRTRR